MGGSNLGDRDLVLNAVAGENRVLKGVDPHGATVEANPEGFGKDAVVPAHPSVPKHVVAFSVGQIRTVNAMAGLQVSVQSRIE